MPDQSIEDPAKGGKAAAGNPSGETSSSQNGKDAEAGKTQVTLADLDARLAQSEARNKTANATLYQGVQSLIDRQGQNLKAATESVNRYTEQLEAIGVEVTDEQKEQLRQAEAMHTLTAPGEQEPATDTLPANQRQEPEPDRPQLSPTQQVALAMMDETGIRLSQTDTAELALIDQETTDLEVFRASFKAALDAKVNRLAGVETPGENEPTDTDNQNKPGPKMNPRGKGSTETRLLSEKTPGGAKTSSLDFLSAGYQESDDFPSED